MRAQVASPKYKRAANRKNSLIHMELVGARELEAALHGLGQDRLIKATMRRALLKASQPAAATARRRCRRSGTSIAACLACPA
mgnify:CR=1 FL=1